MIKDNVACYATLLCKQNACLVNYANIRIGGLSDEMLYNVSGNSVKDNILMSPFIVDIHQTKFIKTKGIWTIETTKEDLHKAIQDVETLLALLPEAFLNELFSMYDEFSTSRVIPSYGTLYLYTERITSNVSTALNNEDTTYSKPPTNAWNHDKILSNFCKTHWPSLWSNHIL
eukprot:14505398-Ditylum_brightwellii.AAC.1